MRRTSEGGRRERRGEEEIDPLVVVAEVELEDEEAASRMSEMSHREMTEKNSEILRALYCER